MTSKYPRALVIRFVDWEALYVDGKLAVEGLELRVPDLIDALYYDTDIMVRDIRWHLSNPAMEKVLDARKLHDTLCPLTLIEFGEENISHVRV